MRRLTVCLLAACGDAAMPSGMPDAAPGGLVPGCALVAASQFLDPSAFGPATAGSLAGWEPDGRWFITGTPFGGVSSVWLERRDGQITLDGAPAVASDTELFTRSETVGEGEPVIVAERISNRLADGSLRIERGSCAGTSCAMCTARLERATHLPGEGEGDGLALVGALADPSWGPGYTFNVRVAGTLAYLIRQDGLHVIETADPAHPVERGWYRRAMAGYANDVKLVSAGARRYAVIADTPVDIVDVTDPAAPVLAATIAESSHTLATEQRDGRTLAYLGNYDGHCPVYDVSDPTAPVKLGTFNTSSSLMHDLYVEDGIAYLNAWERGFLVVDYTNPLLPLQLGAWPATPIRRSHSSWTIHVAGRHLALHGEEGYNAHLNIVDVDPDSATFMQPIAAWQTRAQVSIHNVMAVGATAYLTHYQDGVRVLDLSTPTAPRQVGYYNTWDPQAPTTTSHFYEGAVGLDVDPARHLVFVADSPRGLLILRDTTP